MAKNKQSVSKENKALAKYEPNERERATLDKHKERKKKTAPAPKIKMHEGYLKIDHLSPEHGLDLFLESIGTTSEVFGRVLMGQLAAISLTGEGEGVADVDPLHTNFGLAIVAGVKPRNELEAMLAVQMATIHCATISFAMRLNNAATLEQRESAERALNKLARTFTSQIEALKRYRGGEQKITVQHHRGLRVVEHA